MKKKLLKLSAIVFAVVLSVTLVSNIVNVSAASIEENNAEVCTEDCSIEDNIAIYDNETYTEYALEYLALHQQIVDSNGDMMFEEKKAIQENMSTLRAQLKFIENTLDENGVLTEEDLAQLDTIQEGLGNKMAKRGYNKIKTNNGNRRIKENQGDEKVKSNNGNKGNKGSKNNVVEDFEQDFEQTVAVF